VWVGLLVVAACVAFIFVQLDPALLLRNTTSSGGDTGAHVWWPAFLRDHLLPWRLSGWSPDYYAGFPAGQFYFPFPALLIVGLNGFINYNVAFKLITALGPLLLPVGAYVFARGLRAPEPTPAAFAVAATGFLFFNGDPGATTFDRNTVAFDQHIMGGTLASNLAGEFSYTIALALALCFLGALAWSLRTRRGLWLPVVLLAAVAMSHIVVAVFAVVGGVVVVAGSSPKPWTRGRRRAAWIALGALLVVGPALLTVATGQPGGVASVVLAGIGVLIVLFTCWPRETLGRAAAIGAVGVLLTAVWSVPLVATLQYTTDMRYAAITQYGSFLFPWSYLFGIRGALPWQWGAAVLITIAVVGGVLGRRRSTLVLAVLTGLTGLMFVVWASVQATPAWTLRVLPFWYLCVFLMMGVGVAELIRGAAWLARRAQARHLAARADDELFEAVPSRWTTVAPRVVGIGTAVVLTVLLTVGTLINIDASKDFLPYWVKWNESGYQDLAGQGPGLKKDFPEYQRLMNTIGRLPDPGRTMFEGGPGINVYGTPLALMLLPYWTNGRFPTMEGLYYESSATTPYVFMAIATLAGPNNSSNPVRGVPYRTIADFTLGVRYMQMLGVRYYVAHSSVAQEAAKQSPALKLVATSPTSRGGIYPDTWRIYRVAASSTVSPLTAQPVVLDPLSSSEQAICRQEVIDNGVDPGDVTLHDWQDCIGVPWFNDPTALDRVLVADGPAAWQHAQATPARQLARRPLPSVRVTHIRQTDTSISFDVSRTGVPVLVKTSYFPNWQASGASGPYRSTPNFMVVVPTSHHVTLTYGTTGAEWLGRILTLLGVAGVGLLIWWARRTRRLAGAGGTAGRLTGA
ncbi:MAG TPA: hypothetical protein VGU73_00225, partial [Acidimicrobiia bacterium]|nr:hypothetical protein [Acidimicrobiia bacterium]